MSNQPPSIHEQFREIWDFVHEKCEKEAKLITLHALDECAPACEMLTTPPRFEAWEDPSMIDAGGAWGIPGKDFRGMATDQFNFCPYCKAHNWTSLSCAVGQLLQCLHCGGKFRRSL